MFKNYMTEEAGASAAEYALILAIVGAVIATATIALRGEIVTAINGATNNVKVANGTTGAV
jgi:pilus assembly protein Flp/PilA